MKSPVLSGSSAFGLSVKRRMVRRGDSSDRTAQVHPRPAYSLAVGSLGEDQTCSLVSRSDQRCGRINVPKAAMAQIVARRRKLAKRKNPLFMLCTESGPMTSPPYNDLIVPLHSACQPHPQRHDSSGDFFLRREEQ